MTTILLVGWGVLIGLGIAGVLVLIVDYFDGERDDGVLVERFRSHSERD